MNSGLRIGGVWSLRLDIKKWFWVFRGVEILGLLSSFPIFGLLSEALRFFRGWLFTPNLLLQSILQPYGMFLAHLTSKTLAWVNSY